jgi:hypothetical protein
VGRGVSIGGCGNASLNGCLYDLNGSAALHLLRCIMQLVRYTETQHAAVVQRHSQAPACTCSPMRWTQDALLAHG